MAVFQSIMANFTTFIMAIILTVIPYAGFELPVIDNKEEDCLLILWRNKCAEGKTCEKYADFDK